MERRKKQFLGVIGIVAVLFGILVLPILAERLLGVDAIQAAFVVIVFYAGISWWMKKIR